MSEGIHAITGNECIARIDKIKVSIPMTTENVTRLHSCGPDFLEAMLEYNCIEKWSTPRIMPMGKDIEPFKKSPMISTESRDLFIGIFFPRGHLPPQRALEQNPFLNPDSMSSVNFSGNSALRIILANKEKARWNIHHMRILNLAHALDDFNLPYRISEWEIALDTCNKTIGQYLARHAVMQYLRLGNPNTIFFYGPNGYEIGSSSDGIQQYEGRRESSRQTLAYDRPWTCSHTKEEGSFSRIEYRLRNRYLKNKIPTDCEDPIEKMFRLSRPITEGTPDNPRQACLQLKRLHISELPSRVRSSLSTRETREIRKLPFIGQKHKLLLRGVDRQAIERATENLSWPDGMIWTTDVPNAPLTVLDDILDREFVNRILQARD